MLSRVAAMGVLATLAGCSGDDPGGDGGTDSGLPDAGSEDAGPELDSGRPLSYGSCATVRSCDDFADVCIPMRYEGREEATCTSACLNSGGCPLARGFTGECLPHDGEPEPQRICYQKCDTDEDCAAQYVCEVVTIEGETSADSVCVPE